MKGLALPGDAGTPSAPLFFCVRADLPAMWSVVGGAAIGILLAAALFVYWLSYIDVSP